MTRPAARLRLIVVMAFAFAVYAPSLANRFALDDRLLAMSVRDDGSPNRMVRDLQPLATYFTTNYWQGLVDRDILFRPITVLSYAVTYATVGRHLDGEAGEAKPQHALNLLLHLSAVGLVYRLARVVRVRRGPSLVAALVFAVHAIHSEVVAGVVGRAELLAFDFGALATLAFMHAARSRARAPLAAAASALSLFLALGSKESAVAWIPFLLVVGLVRDLQRARSGPDARLGRLLMRRGRRWLAVVALPLTVYLVLRAQMIAKIGADPAVWEQALVRATPGSPFGNGVVQWVYALAASILPTHLAADWGPMVFMPVASATAPIALGAAALMLLVLGVALVRWRRQPIVFLAAATWFGHSILVSNVPFRIGTDYAERLYYAPSLGVALLGAAVARWWPHAHRRAGIVLLGAWIAWNAWLVLQRNPVWYDNETLHRAEVVNQPRSVRIHLQWASQLEKRGELEAIVPHLERVVALLPEHAAAWNHLGTVHARAGRNAQALRCFVRSVEALDGTPTVRAAAAINLALARALGGEVEAATSALELALRADPAETLRRLTGLRQNFAALLPAPWWSEFERRLQQASAIAAPQRAR